MPTQTATDPMELGDYARLLLRHWPLVLLGLVIGLVLSASYLREAPREYQSRAAVLVLPVSTPTTNNQGNRAPEVNLDTEAQLVTSTDTATAAAELMELPGDQARALSRSVGVTVPPNSEVLEIVFTGATASRAQEGAAAFAQAYLDGRKATAQAAVDVQVAALQARIDGVNQQIQDLARAAVPLAAGSPERALNQQQIATLTNQITSLATLQEQVRSAATDPGRVVTQPALPSEPSSPDRFITLAGGAALGLLLGIALAALRHRFDDRLRTPADVRRRTALPVVATLTQPLSDSRGWIVAPLGSDGRAAARLRNLVTTALADSRRVVLVAGVRRGGGPVAVNLALSLARTGQDVVLVCADVHGTTASVLLGAAPDAGIGEVLADEADLDTAAVAFPDVPSLRVLGPGADADRADALLQTRGPLTLVDQMLDSADHIVIEAPATTDSSDAQTLAAVASLVVLVVEAGRARAREVQDAVAQFESVRAPVLGAVVARYRRSGLSHPTPSGQRGSVGTPPTAGDGVARPAVPGETRRSQARHAATTTRDAGQPAEAMPRTVPEEATPGAPASRAVDPAPGALDDEQSAGRPPIRSQTHR
jgi:uncharacterized protein involved in exopolysaccharide biosynthesis